MKCKYCKEFPFVENCMSICAGDMTCLPGEFSECCSYFDSELFDFELWFKDINKNQHLYYIRCLRNNLQHRPDLFVLFDIRGHKHVSNGETLLELAENFEKEWEVK